VAVASLFSHTPPIVLKFSCRYYSILQMRTDHRRRDHDLCLILIFILVLERYFFSLSLFVTSETLIYQQRQLYARDFAFRFIE
jgi:hypothetical protein